MGVITYLLDKYVNQGASDIHIHCGSIPYMRLQSKIIELDEPIIRAKDMQDFLDEINLPHEKYECLDKLGACDIGYEFNEVCCLRINIYKCNNDMGMAVRVLNGVIPEFDTLNLPDYMKNVCNLKSGLVLVTGLTGNGKSTTIASLVNLINQSCNKHIITIEDPIEYRYPKGKCFITQREIPRDCESFEEGLRSAMRQDPDIIVIGEMRDKLTVNVTMEAAESGHLVFSTLHTSSAAASIDRLMSYFPEEEQNTARGKLANVLSAVFTQKLIPSADGKCMYPAIESMFTSVPIKALIREGKIFQITNYIKLNRSLDMYTMEDYLADMVGNGLITMEDAIPNANDLQSFQAALKDYKLKNEYNQYIKRIL